MKGFRSLMLMVGLWMAGVSFAEAHAFLDRSDPAVGSAVQGSPTVIKIWFTRHLKSGESTIEVLDAGGREMEPHPAKIDPADPTLMTVAVSRLPAGTYKVVWKAVCLDTHTTHGSFTFEVK
jgi:methionine-rich copper-binding protein CopC